MSINVEAWKQRKDKALKAYATYTATKATVNQYLDRHSYEWNLDGDFIHRNLFRAAAELITENIIRTPFGRSECWEHHTDTNDPLRSLHVPNWTWMKVPGTKMLVQAKKRNEMIYFRSVSQRTVNTLREIVMRRKEEIDAASPEIQVNQDNYTPSVDLYTWNPKSSQWDYRSTRNGRRFDSVFIPTELSREILADVQRFTASKSRMERLELAWRRGYLFAGPPGTGKTSMSIALATALEFNLATLSLSEVTGDAELRSCFAKIRGNTVLVLEDIDAYSVSHERDHNVVRDGALSLSGLLNALDGIETPEGLVVVATTNHPEKLDEALIRPGRFDRQFTLDYIAPTEFERLFAWFYEATIPAPAPVDMFDAKITPAQVMELLKQHYEDSEAGWKAVMEEVAKRLGNVEELDRQMMEVVA